MIFEGFCRNVGKYEIYYDEKSGSIYKGKFVIMLNGKVVDVKDFEPDAVDYIQNVLLNNGGAEKKIVKPERKMNTYKVIYVNSGDSSSYTYVEAYSEKEAEKKVKDLYGKEIYYILSVEKEENKMSDIKTVVNEILDGGSVRKLLSELRSESNLSGKRIIANIDKNCKSEFYKALEQCYVIPDVIMESDERLQIVFPSEADIRSKFNALMKDYIINIEK